MNRMGQVLQKTINMQRQQSIKREYSQRSRNDLGQAIKKTQSPRKQINTSSPSLSQTEILARTQIGSAFYTQIKLHNDSEQQLQAYIQSLHKQVSNALWKQELLLEYNYLPLESIKQKIQFEHQTYLKKMEAFKEEHRKIFQNEQFIEELENLRKFNLKLKEKMKEYEAKLEEARVRKEVIGKQAAEKKNRLKDLIRGNMALSKDFVERFGVKNKEDIARMVKARSQRSLKSVNNTIGQYQSTKNLKSNNPSNLKRSQSAHISKQTPKSSNLYQQCLNLLIGQIKLMNSSNDIQSGIYLQIMPKSLNKLSTAGKISHKSNISNTLHERYEKKISRANNKHYEEEDFDMAWDTFKELNWKQMLGVVMVKDKNLEKLKRIVSL